MVHDPKVLVIPKFLPPGICKRLCVMYDAYEPVAANQDYNRRPVCHYTTLQEGDREIVRDAATRVMQKVRGRTRLPVLPEAVFLAKIGVGHSHPLHRDNCKADGSPNHTPQRDYSSLVYLNGDFDGGEIALPNQRLVIKPKTGMLVGFPSGYDYPHEAYPVLKGWRYSMPVWMTFDPKFQLLLK